MNFGITTKLVAAAFGLSGFAVAIIAGLAAGNASHHVLATALVSMVLCQFAGLIAGFIIERVLAEHLAVYRRSHPIPSPAREPEPADSNISPQKMQET